MEDARTSWRTAQARAAAVLAVVGLGLSGGPTALATPDVAFIAGTMRPLVTTVSIENANAKISDSVAAKGRVCPAKKCWS